MYVLVTGATGFIGAHVVDELLSLGHQVRAASRSCEKGQLLKQDRPDYASQIDIVQIADFTQGTSFAEAVQGVDGVIHVASPLDYTITDNEKDMILPAIAGVKAILQAAEGQESVKRVVITSSFAAVLDVNRAATPHHTYTAKDWNPLTYEEAIAKDSNAIIGYRASKKFAELEAWKFVEERKPSFDIVTICPPMTFGPVRHPVSKLANLNESNANLWKVASGAELPVSRVPLWVNVRDLAKAHVEALLRKEAGGKRYTIASPEKFSYKLAGDIVTEEFGWGRERVAKGEKQNTEGTHDLDGETVARELGLTYTSFRETVKAFVEQAVAMERRETS
ncbi:NAD dependent epimerase/dehydratase [Amniculicola lignicola CBS 123094]|uniref:NAD dependent epimerase/dehydratase n=1 Tax=Amniculicola lignicola CBS 123094 TaxID=1392246 RepID=A0A6A5VXS1_9PLEO|nr:NAD dependent epimerase/dehydratase [Amniculicola lignicola CBS 123094]